MKKTIILLLTALSVLRLSAQHERQWSLLLPRGSALEITAVAAFAGGYAYAGVFTDTLSIAGEMLRSNGGRDVFLLHVTGDGVLRGAVSFGGPGDDTPSCLAVVDSALYICGLSSSDTCGVLFIRSFDPEYRPQKLAEYPYSGRLNVDMIDGDTVSLAVGGSLKGRMSLGAEVILSEGAEHAFLVLFSGSLEVREVWNTGGSGRHRLHACAMGRDNSYVLALNVTKGTFGIPGLPSFSMDRDGVVVTKIGRDLTPVWVRPILCDGYIEASSMTVVSTGFVLCVNHNGTLTMSDSVLTSRCSLSSIIACYDEAGSIVWIAEVDSDEYCRLIDTDAFGDLIACTGYHYGELTVQGETLQSSPERQTFLVALDGQGLLQWHVGSDLVEPNGGMRMACDTSALLLCGTGETVSFSDRYRLSGSNMENPSVENSALPFDTGGTSACVGADTLPPSPLDVFPNPVRSVLFWRANLDGEWTMELHGSDGTCLGRELHRGFLSGSLDLSGLAAGVYVLKISSANNTFHQTIVKY